MLFQKTRRRCTRRSLQCRETQALEARIVPAGNVVASMANGNLTLTGDNSSNRITVFESEGEIRIIPRSGTSTTINGEQSVTLPGPISGNLKVKMKGGDDFVTVEADVGKSVNANMGAGTDVLSLRTMTVTRNVKINMGTGTDDLSWLSMTVNGNVNINMGGTTGRAEDTSLASSQIGGSFKYKGGTGDQNVEILFSQIAKNASFNLGSGDDSVVTHRTIFDGLVKANGGSGTDLFDGPDNANIRNFEL